jgi:hypothetical protein
MAAATENSKVYTDYWGRTPVVILDVTWTNGDTYTAVDLGAVLAAEFWPTTTMSAMGLTLATNVVTLVSGGSLTGKLIVYGNAQ